MEPHCRMRGYVLLRHRLLLAHKLLQPHSLLQPLLRPRLRPRLLRPRLRPRLLRPRAWTRIGSDAFTPARGRRSRRSTPRTELLRLPPPIQAMRSTWTNCRTASDFRRATAGKARTCRLEGRPRRSSRLGLQLFEPPGVHRRNVRPQVGLLRPQLRLQRQRPPRPPGLLRPQGLIRPQQRPPRPQRQLRPQGLLQPHPRQLCPRRTCKGWRRPLEPWRRPHKT